MALLLRVSSAPTCRGDFAACARFYFICDCLLKECFTFKPQSPPPASERLFGGENSLWSLAIGLWCDLFLRVSSAFGGDFAACARFNFICDCLLKECFTFKPQSTPPASERLFGGENSLWSLALLLRVSSAFGGDFAACARFNFICDFLVKEYFIFQPQSTPPASERLFGEGQSV